MKTNKLYTIPLMLASSVAFPMGMGDIRVESFINQPFSAEIPLLDIGNDQLSTIQASLASPDEYERIGLVPDDSLPFLKFQVVRNDKGQAVIKISSIDRITEPYLRILVDLAWSKGEIYRTYTVLLDPPGYKLGVANNHVTQHNGRADSFHKNAYVETISAPATPEYHARAIVYGPTLVNENIWQISQRYLSSGATLQQIILAIVGTNSQAFTQGNLNGLKIGERLRIPSKEEVLKVPVELARQEVDAHDLAWKSRQEIKHVLLPPYIDGVAGVSQFKPAEDADSDALSSIIPQAPQFKINTQQFPVGFSDVSLVPDVLFQSNKDTPIIISYLPSVSDLQSMANLADNSERASLKKQLQDLQQKNNQLQMALLQHNRDVKPTDIKTNPTDKSQAVQISQNKVAAPPPADSSSYSWFYWLLVAGLAGGGAYIYRMRSKPSQEVHDEQIFKSMIAAPSIGAHDKIIPETADKTSGDVSGESGESGEAANLNALSIENPVGDGIHTSDKIVDNSLQEEIEQLQADDVVTQEDDNTLPEDNDEQPVLDNTVEFESGLDKHTADAAGTEMPSVTASEHDDHGLAFDTAAPPADEPHESLDVPHEEIAVEHQVHDTQPIDFVDSDILESKEAEDNSLEFTVDTKESADPSLLVDEMQDAPKEQDEGLVFEADPDLLDDAEQIDLTIDSHEDNQLSELNIEDTAPKLIKSKTALDTLLALAQTYISMEDYESARQSLNELLAFGDENQKQEAQKLIDEIANK